MISRLLSYYARVVNFPVGKSGLGYNGRKYQKEDPDNSNSVHDHFARLIFFDKNLFLMEISIRRAVLYVNEI